jgi:SHS2 domain-containing protein
METKFEVFEHTADTGIIARGGDIKEAFASAAEGMFSLITGLDDIEEAESREIDIKAADRESLLVAWLNELIYYFDTENLLFKRFDIASLSRTHLKAIAYGEKVDLSRHEIKIGIKAATYHMLKVEEGKSSTVRVLFDI